MRLETDGDSWGVRRRRRSVRATFASKTRAASTKRSATAIRAESKSTVTVAGDREERTTDENCFCVRGMRAVVEDRWASVTSWGSLPVELAKRGHKVMTISPRYDQYKGAWDTSVHVEALGKSVGFFHEKKKGVDRVFVDHPRLLG